MHSMVLDSRSQQKTKACEPTSDQRHSMNSASASIKRSPIQPGPTHSISNPTVACIERTTVGIIGTIFLKGGRPDSQLFWDYTLKILTRYSLCPRTTLKRAKPAEQGDMFPTRRSSFTDLGTAETIGNFSSSTCHP